MVRRKLRGLKTASWDEKAVGVESDHGTVLQIKRESSWENDEPELSRQTTRMMR